MGETFQVYRAAANAAKGIRQFQKADEEIYKDNMDSAAKHYEKALEHYDAALDELGD